MFRELLGLKHITPQHLDAVHRMGERKQNAARLTIVHFVSRLTRLEELRKRRMLKGSNPKVVNVDDLTRSNYQLFLRASEHPRTLRAWRKDGRIFVQSIDFKVFKIDKLADLSKLSIDATASPSSSAPVRRLMNARRNSKRTDISLNHSALNQIGNRRREKRSSSPSFYSNSVDECPISRQ